jgi:hypothetical protein
MKRFSGSGCPADLVIIAKGRDLRCNGVEQQIFRLTRVMYISAAKIT